MAVRTTLRDARLEAAREAGMAFSGTCSGAGTTSSLVDIVLSSVGVSTKYLEHGWLYRRAAAAADRQRNIATDGFTVSTGALAPDRIWSDAPDESEAYEVYSLVPPTPQAGVPVSWNRAINNALQRMWYVDEIVLGRGTPARDRVFSLSRGEVTLIALVVCDGGSGATITPPTGWTLIRRTNSGTDLAVATYWKRAAADDTELFSFTLDTTRAAAGGIMGYIDANVDDPVDVDGQTTTASSVTATAPAVTATVGRGRVLHAYAAVGGLVVATPTTDLERFDASSDDPAAVMTAALSDLELSGVGATESAAATLGAAGINIGNTIVLQPLTDARDVAPVSRGTTGNNGAGATTLDLPRPSSLPNDDWTPDEGSIRKVLLRTAVGTNRWRDVDANRGGRTWWPVLVNGEVAVELMRAPSNEVMVVAEVQRPYATLSADTDETTCPLDRLVAMSIWQLYTLLNGSAAGIGQYQAEEAKWEAEAEKANRKYIPKDMVLV